MTVTSNLFLQIAINSLYKQTRKFTSQLFVKNILKLKTIFFSTASEYRLKNIFVSFHKALFDAENHDSNNMIMCFIIGCKMYVQQLFKNYYSRWFVEPEHCSRKFCQTKIKMDKNTWKMQ